MVAVCTVLDVVAMLLMTIPGITLHQIYAVPNLASFEKREEKEDMFEDIKIIYIYVYCVYIYIYKYIIYIYI